MQTRWNLFDTDNNQALDLNEFFSFRYPEAAKDSCTETSKDLMSALGGPWMESIELRF
jgi:hypothetical protein